MRPIRLFAGSPTGSTSSPRRTTTTVAGAVAVLVAAMSAIRGVGAATPPVLVNYQGVLRDQSDKPLSGSYDMLFRFMDADTAGNEILIDQHAAVTANAVTVSGGLFSVALGSGTITDGSGAGAYTSLDAVFRDYGSVWLEVRIGAETLSPRTRIQSAPYALNASSAVNAIQLNGQPASSFLDTSSATQIKAGRLEADSGASSGFGLVGQDAASYGTGVYGSGDGWGVQGNSVHNGGTFSGNDYGVTASASNYAAGLFQGLGPAYGVWATGDLQGGKFESRGSNASSADLANGYSGVAGTCTHYGGTGVSGNGERNGVYGYASGQFAGGAQGGVFAADGASSVGIKGTGSTGGEFFSPAAPGAEVDVAGPGGGIVSTGFTNYGASFQGAGSGSIGVYASGGDRGGSFQGIGSAALGLTATGATGVFGTGTSFGIRGTGSNAGALFDNPAGTSAYLATSTMGISAGGTSSGAYLADGSPWFSYAYVPYQGDGVYGYGSGAGGEFHNFSTSSYAYVGWSTYKIGGNGTVAFIQNHPGDPSKVIVYNAPEGDEVAVYTRGSGRLANGVARVALGETFALVTNPDIGLTATVTPRGEPIPLAVSEVSPGELVVRGPAGSDAAFDYMVWGLRIGFEEQSIVQPKHDESKIPSMQPHEKFFHDEPALRRFTALARYKDVEEAVHGRKPTEFPRADRLRNAVGMFSPADPSTATGRAPDRPAPGRPAPERPQGDVASSSGGGVGGGAGAGATEPATAPADIPPPAATAVADERDLFVAEGAIETGDVVSLSEAAPGSVVRSSGPADALVIGCALARDASSAQVAVATSHVALCRVDAAYGAIAVGDRLTASPGAGAAMKAVAAAGTTILGRALEPLESGSGLVRVLVGAR